MAAHEEVDVAARRLVALAELDDLDVTTLVQHAAGRSETILVGLDNRIKNVESLGRKLGDMLAQDPDLDLEIAVQRVFDVLRFTVVADPDGYVAAHTTVLGELRHQGVVVVADDNRWQGPGYRGINVRLRLGASTRFEVQFHTRASFEAAKATRGLYEEMRQASTTAARRFELVELIDAIFARVPVPRGAVGSSS